MALSESPAVADLPTLRLEITTPPTDDPTMALTPDGTRIAFVANQNRVPMVWVRALDGIESRALPGTEGASFPFWSPDGKSLGFFADGKLKRIDVDGGRPIVVADAPNGRGGTWNRDGVILFSPGVSNPVMRVSTGGGAAEALTETNTGGTGQDHRWPQFLPDGKRFLFSSTLGAQETKGIYIGSLDKTPYVRVRPGDSAGRFAAPDKLLLTSQGALESYTFDPASGAVTARQWSSRRASPAASVRWPRRKRACWPIAQAAPSDGSSCGSIARARCFVPSASRRSGTTGRRS